MLKIFNLIGSLALFIYGIQVMGEGLQRAAGEKVRYILKTLTHNPIIGVVLGATITSLIQSSSATSVLAIGFVNSGLMKFTEALGIILGANIGTTVTAQLISFKLTHIALPILALGFTLNFVCKNNKWKNLGYFFLGFGILFLGLSMMANILKPLASNPIAKEFFIKYSHNTLIALIIGIVATTIFQSSSSSTGVVIILASAGLLDLRGAIPIILGCNIGTCTTALIACIGTNRQAKQVALSHLLFNVIGSLIFLPFIKTFYNIALFTSTDVARQIANAHTIFNVINTLIFLPFIKYYALLIQKLIPIKLEEDFNCHDTKYLDKNLLSTPSIAIEAAIKEILRMLRLTQKMFIESSNNFIKNNKDIDKIDNWENAVDNRRLNIIEYLTKIMEEPLNHNESIKIPALMHVASDIERIGDHAVNLKKLSLQKNEKKLLFSSMAVIEFNNMNKIIIYMINQVIKALNSNDVKEAKVVFNYENEINNIRNIYRKNHICRLTHKECDPLSGIVFLDTIANFEKIGDHLTNIGQAVLDGLQWSSNN